MIGDIGIEDSLTNLRAAVAAAYNLNNIVDRQLIRPLFVNVIPGDYEHSSLNVKTGDYLF